MSYYGIFSMIVLLGFFLSAYILETLIDYLIRLERRKEKNKD